MGTQVKIPRVLFAAPSSNTGKTTVVCACLRALQRRGIKLMACKCGPDYIDPQFHRQVIGVKSRNIDLFMAGKGRAQALFVRACRSCELTVIEGAMGFYDGISTTPEASAWEVACVTETPVVLVVDARGRALSLAAEVMGLMKFREPSMIAGVIFNRVSDMFYPQLKEAVERECGVPVLGYLPRLDESYCFESRHLGLVRADEIENIQCRLDALADVAERTLDLDGIVRVAQEACALGEQEGVFAQRGVEGGATRPVIAVARDAAFDFYYEDSLDALRDAGAELVEFSPMHDAELPAGASGIYLGGGYPELHASELSANESMRASVLQAIRAGMPTIAECGGFLYLHDELEDDEGVPHAMVGVIEARAHNTGKLGRFGYVTLTTHEDGLVGPAGTDLTAHEFHYWDSSLPGDACTAQKPHSARSWQCAHITPSMYAGFPHLYIAGKPDVALRFVQAAAAYAPKGEA